MYRLALIAIDSGACVANPVYETEKECWDQANMLYMTPLGETTVQLDSDVDGRVYIVPVRPKDFVVVIEPINDEVV